MFCMQPPLIVLLGAKAKLNSCEENLVLVALEEKSEIC